MNNSLNKAISLVGSVNLLAELLGLRQSAVSNWHRRGVPIDKCLDIQKATKGKVTCYDLRPDKFPKP